MESSKKYAGNPYTCSNTISVAFICFGTILYFVCNPNMRNVIICAFYLPVVCLVVFLLYMNSMHYFIIDDGNLIIKNHYLPWRKRVVLLSNITAFAIVKPYKRSKALRIYTKDLHSKRFCAGSLREKDWKKLVKDLRHLGIFMKKYIYD